MEHYTVIIIILIIINLFQIKQLLLIAYQLWKRDDKSWFVELLSKYFYALHSIIPSISRLFQGALEDRMDFEEILCCCRRKQLFEYWASEELVAMAVKR